MAETVDNTEPLKDEEVLTFKTKTDKKPDRVILFKIDDEEFDVPRKPGMGTVMRYLNVARKTGNDLMAAHSLLEEMLGEEKWDKFINWIDLDDETMGAVLSKCISLAVASVEDTSAK